MPEKPIANRQKATEQRAPANPPNVQAIPSPPPRTIIAEERGQDGSYTIWWSDGSVESGQGGG
jgi:hypothetical protein